MYPGLWESTATLFLLAMPALRKARLPTLTLVGHLLCADHAFIYSHMGLSTGLESLYCASPWGAVLPLAAPFSRKPIKFIQDRLIAPVRRLLSYRPEKMVPEMRCWQVEVEGNG